MSAIKRAAVGIFIKRGHNNTFYLYLTWNTQMDNLLHKND